MSAELRDQLGAAMNSQRAILLYGPPGAGKTFLCEQMARLLTGDIAVPYAVEVGGEIIRLRRRKPLPTFAMSSCCRLAAVPAPLRSCVTTRFIFVADE